MSDSNIYRIFECKNGDIYEIAFIKSKESARFYLDSSNSHNTNPNIFYFAEQIKVEN